MMGEDIKNVKLNFTCPANWDAMPNVNGGRHCDKCHKTVYDFTNSKAAEFERVMSENNYSICGRFTKEQVYTEPAIVPAWKKWVSAAMVLISFSFFTNNALAQKIKQKQAKHKAKLPQATVTMGDVVLLPSKNDTLKVKTDTGKNEIFGGVSEVSPEFKGGMEAFKAFITKSIDYTKSTEPCRVNVIFTVEKDGSLTNIQSVGRKTNTGAENEAIRVIKLSPKWNPGKQNGQPVRVQYTIPIIFN